MIIPQQLCVDPQCHLQQKLINSPINIPDHKDHQLINLDEVREDLNKISHPIRQVIKLQSSDQIISDIDKHSYRLQEMFLKHLDLTVKDLKRAVTSTATEINNYKELHDALFNEAKISAKQTALSRFMKKMNSKYIKRFLIQVTRVRKEPQKVLDDLEQKLSEICQVVEIVPEQKIIKDKNKIKLNKKYKSTTKIEDLLLQELEQEKEKDMNELEIDLMGQITNRKELLISSQIFDSISQFKNLSSLKINLSSTNIQDVSELSKAISILTNLTSLQLSLGNSKVQKINEIGISIGYLKNLKKLELSLWSTNLVDVEEVGKGIAQIKSLRTLEMQLGNTFVTEIIELGKGIGENKHLKQFSLNLEYTLVGDISDLGCALHSLKNLEEFELDLVDTQVNGRIRKNYYTLQNFLCDWKQYNLKSNE